MTRFARTFSILILVISASCTFYASKQDPDKAAAGAIVFAKAALVDRDMDKSYGLLDPEVQSNASVMPLN